MGILEEAGVLFTRFTLESYMRFHNKLDVRRSQPIHEVVELVDGIKGNARVWNGNFVAIHGIVIIDAAVIITDHMAYNLMSMQIKILPVHARASLGTTQNIAVKFFGYRHIMHRKSIMKSRTMRIIHSGMREY